MALKGSRLYGSMREDEATVVKYLFYENGNVNSNETGDLHQNSEGTLAVEEGGVYLLEELYFCDNCSLLCRRYDLVEEIEGYYCTSCCESFLPSEANFLGNKCKKCFECPQCETGLITVVASLNTASQELISSEKQITWKLVEANCQSTGTSKQSINESEELGESVEFDCQVIKKEEVDCRSAVNRKITNNMVTYLWCPFCRWSSRSSGLVSSRAEELFSECLHRELVATRDNIKTQILSVVRQEAHLQARERELTRRLKNKAIAMLISGTSSLINSYYNRIRNSHIGQRLENYTGMYDEGKSESEENDETCMTIQDKLLNDDEYNGKRIGKESNNIFLHDDIWKPHFMPQSLVQSKVKLPLACSVRIEELLQGFYNICEKDRRLWRDVVNLDSMETLLEMDKLSGINAPMRYNIDNRNRSYNRKTSYNRNNLGIIGRRRLSSQKSCRCKRCMRFVIKASIGGIGTGIGYGSNSFVSQSLPTFRLCNSAYCFLPELRLVNITMLENTNTACAIANEAITSGCISLTPNQPKTFDLLLTNPLETPMNIEFLPFISTCHLSNSSLLTPLPFTVSIDPYDDVAEASDDLAQSFTIISGSHNITSYTMGELARARNNILIRLTAKIPHTDTVTTARVALKILVHFTDKTNKSHKVMLFPLITLGKVLPSASDLLRTESI